MQYIGDDDGEETEEQHCSTGVDHWMEYFHRNQRWTREIWHLLKHWQENGKILLKMITYDFIAEL